LTAYRKIRGYQRRSHQQGIVRSNVFLTFYSSFTHTVTFGNARQDDIGNEKLQGSMLTSHILILRQQVPTFDGKKDDHITNEKIRLMFFSLLIVVYIKSQSLMP
jgi:quinol-cytochrome oxidoreductase complex cytochrome b subunit